MLLLYPRAAAAAETTWYLAPNALVKLCQDYLQHLATASRRVWLDRCQSLLTACILQYFRCVEQPSLGCPGLCDDHQIALRPHKSFLVASRTIDGRADECTWLSQLHCFLCTQEIMLAGAEEGQNISAIHAGFERQLLELKL